MSNATPTTTNTNTSVTTEKPTDNAFSSSTAASTTTVTVSVSDSTSSNQSINDGTAGVISKELKSVVTSDGLRIESNWDQVVTSFDDMNLKDELLRCVYSYGFEKPSPIQQWSIMPMLAGHDMIVQAQSGTGKTAIFCIAALQAIDLSRNQCQALIVVPARELAQSMRALVRDLGDFLKVTTHACVGGALIRDDIRILREGVQIVLGTPGRVYDMIKRNELSLAQVKIFVLDEADEMLSRGFKDQIYDILQLLPQTVQIGLFSATMAQDILEISRRFMREPVRIFSTRDELTLEGVKQYYIDVVRDEWKFETLCDLYDTICATQSTIYCNTRKQVDWLADQMRQRDYSVSSMHSDMTQVECETIIKEFRAGSTRILITTDLSGRSMVDVSQISFVVNYSLPTNHENYVYRIGRSGHYGRKGVVINFITADDTRAMREIEAVYQTNIDEVPMNINDLLL